MSRPNQVTCAVGTRHASGRCGDAKMDGWTDAWMGMYIDNEPVRLGTNERKHSAVRCAAAAADLAMRKEGNRVCKREGGTDGRARRTNNAAAATSAAPPPRPSAILIIGLRICDSVFRDAIAASASSAAGNFFFVSVFPRAGSLFPRSANGVASLPSDVKARARPGPLTASCL